MLVHQAFLRELQGAYTPALSYREEALELARHIGDPEQLVPALIDIACNIERQGDYDRAESYLQECLSIAEHVAGQETRLCRMFACLSYLAIKRGEYPQAISYCQQGIALDESTQRNYKTYHCLLLSYQALAQTLHSPIISEQVRADMQQALELASSLNDQEIMLKVFGSFGEIATLQGDHERARMYAEQALACARQFQSKSEEVWLLSLLSEISIKQGEYQLAETLLHTEANCCVFNY